MPAVKTCPRATSFNTSKEHTLRDSALLSEACSELNQSIFSSCPVGLDDADVTKSGKAEKCRVVGVSRDLLLVVWSCYSRCGEEPGNRMSFACLVAHS